MRNAPWVVAAVAQAIAIAGLSAVLATRESAAEVAAPAPESALEPLAMERGAAVGSAMAPGPDAATSAEAVRPETGSPRPGVALATDLGTLVYGQVRSRGDAMPQWAIIEVCAGEAARPMALARVSGSNTQYAIAGLADGDYRLVAKAEGFRDLEHRFTVPPGLPSLRLDVELQPSWIVRVVLQTPDGRPLHEALAEHENLPRTPIGGAPVAVLASWRTLPPQLPLSDSRESPFTVGTWTSSRNLLSGRPNDLPARYAGRLEMREKRDAIVAAVFRDVVLAQQPLTAGQEEVALTVDPEQLRANAAAVRLQVVDGATGAPVANAKVGLDDAQSWRQPMPVDEQGRFEQANLCPGRYQLTISASGRVAPRFLVDLSPGRTTDLGTVAVVEPVELHLRVPELADVAEPATVVLRPLDAPADRALKPAPTRVSMRKGVVESRIAPGRYELRATHEGKGTLREIDTRHLGSEPLVLTLVEEAALRIDPSQVDEPVRLELRTANGKSVYDRWITWTGAYEVQLPAGDYSARTERLGGAVHTEAITLPAAGATFVLR